MLEEKSHCVGVHAWCRALPKTRFYRCKYIHGASKSDVLKLCTCIVIFVKMRKIGLKIPEIRSNFTPCKPNSSATFHAHYTYPNFIVLVPSDITSFVGRNERNKVGVRDSGGVKRKESNKNLHVTLLYLKAKAIYMTDPTLNPSRVSTTVALTLTLTLTLTLNPNPKAKPLP